MKNGNTITLTPELTKRLELDLQATIKILIKQLAYPLDLQNKDMIKSYRDHVDYLSGALASGQLTIVIN